MFIIRTKVIPHFSIAMSLFAGLFVLTGLFNTASAAVETECLKRVMTELNLDASLAVEFCTKSSCPINFDCFKKVSSENYGRISVKNAMQLCRCGLSSEPANCFRSAIQVRQMDQDNAVELCAQSTSVVPVSCFTETIMRNSKISVSSAIQICQCTTTAYPAECFQDATITQKLDEEHATKLCRVGCNPLNYYYYFLHHPAQ